MTRSSRRKYAKQRKSNLSWIIGGFAVAILLVAALLIANQFIDKPGGSPIASTGKTWGNANAPVKIEIYSDLQ